MSENFNSEMNAIQEIELRNERRNKNQRKFNSILQRPQRVSIENYDSEVDDLFLRSAAILDYVVELLEQKYTHESIINIIDVLSVENSFSDVDMEEYLNPED